MLLLGFGRGSAMRLFECGVGCLEIHTFSSSGSGIVELFRRSGSVGGLVKTRKRRDRKLPSADT